MNTPRESSTHLLTSEPREPRSSSSYSILPASLHGTARHSMAWCAAWRGHDNRALGGQCHSRWLTWRIRLAITLRHSCRQLDIWAHFRLALGPVLASRQQRPSLFRFGAPSGPLWAGWAGLLSCCLSVRPIPIKIHHQCYCASLLQGSPPLAARCLALSPPPPPPLSLSFPLPACRPNQHIGSILQLKNKVGNQTALSSHPQPITASPEAAHPKISAYPEGLANSGPFDRPYHHPL